MNICIKEGKSKLASHFDLIKCLHSQKRLTSRLVVQSLSMTCWGIMVAYYIGKMIMAFIGMARGMTFAFRI